MSYNVNKLQDSTAEIHVFPSLRICFYRLHDLRALFSPCIRAPKISDCMGQGAIFQPAACILSEIRIKFQASTTGFYSPTNRNTREKNELSNTALSL